MQILKKVIIPMEGRDETVLFGIATSEDREQIFSLRYKIYSKYGYLNEEFYPEKREHDSFDEDGSSRYLVAKVGERIIGCIRLIQSDILPIEKNYNFEPPTEVASRERKEIVELGRLVIDRYSDTEYFPRNIILLFLVATIVHYCKENGTTIAYSFLKKRLIKKLNALHLPYTLIEPFTLLYPKNAPMTPYFYNEEDPAFPAFFMLDAMEKFVEKTIGNRFLFKKKGEFFVLRKNLYTKFLKTAGVI